MILLLDTNFLLLPGQFKLDIFEELKNACGFSYELAITPLVEAELQVLAAGNSKDARAAALGLSLLKAQHINTLPKSSQTKAFKNADDELVHVAKEQDAIVATQDKQLQSRLRAQGTRLAVMRQKTKIMLI